MWVRLSTDEVAVEDRVDWYHDVVSRTVAPHRLVIPDGPRFRARAGVLPLGRIELSRHIHSAHHALRTPRLIRQSDPEHYVLALISRGAKGISQRRNDTVAGSGDLIFFDTSHPYTAGTPSDDDPIMTLLHIPRELLGLPVDRLDAALGSRFTARQGIGAIFRRFTDSLDEHGAECGPQELRILERTALDLASGVLAQQLDAWDSLPTESREQLLLARIDAFIDRHLADPDLTPRTIAAYHHISLSTLYSLFRTREETVAATIRRRRLEHCRADLARGDRPIQTIATRWGFSGAAVFSRAFRDAYGASPREFRTPTD
ncbi:AraC family transcriptional regulator [Streptomyces clavuligerus]|uniref:AraC family transcription regulator n=1 Tax=Streptomyces clavuligerus TaxID=1901 RepID=B5GMC6_STRCL|nr:AraC family transcriptional regulator [Streptomyces clavuligerus]ANW22351.1 AraC family transcriptional regulator [Streptomyces clavuligerus]AXU17251.1 helix-turn-helix domain-containing protein [Streptomyces clavuligerus]EDY47472.1 araC family regulatory protein [Streptomyces clavuligerus]EFG04435.1 AraC family transcription regulator [Streptomyces clavuligerus]MBY6307103.1 helix-turn-helix domain-containing protein [Streptomyces clavuligerus]